MRRNVMAVSFAALCLATPLTAQGAAKPAAGNSASDVALAARVRAALAKELGSAHHRVTIEVHGGTVALQGTVADRDARERAERSAARVSGVARVSASGLLIDRAGRSA
jgi:osmotically-inducible protein OsmY